MAALLLFLTVLFAGAHAGLDPNGASSDAHVILDPNGVSSDAHVGLDPDG